MTLKSEAKFAVGTLMGHLYPMLKIYELKIFRAVMCHANEEWCKISKVIDFLFQNWHEKNDQFWPDHSKVWKLSILMGSFWPKYKMLELKNYREIMFGSAEDWCNIWRRNDLCFQKWDVESGKFS